MEIIRQQDHVVQPWKNGLGSTREILCRHVGGKLAFRLSLARVTSDGPFSRFEGFERILTVVSGDGMRLVGDGEVYQADPLDPIRFSGNAALIGTCQTGPVENFNLIFDPTLVAAEVQVMSAASLHDARPTGSGTITVVYVLSGHLKTLEGRHLEAGDTCLYSDGPFPFDKDGDRRCIRVTLTNRLSSGDEP